VRAAHRCGGGCAAGRLGDNAATSAAAIRGRRSEERMTPSQLSALAVARLAAEDVRRLPMLGIACGMAVAATVLSLIESGLFNAVVVILLWLGVALTLLAVLPIANRLTLSAEGFRVRVLGLLGGFVPWSAVERVEASEGWAGATVVVRLKPEAEGRTIAGLPLDPTLGFHTLTDSYGLDPDDLAHEMERRRAAAHP
jgi:hypothetical protein